MGMNISSDEEQLNATINTTPLVDVMLVLLIIFLITVPVVNKVKKVTLPNVENIPTITKPENIVITVDKDGNTYWNAMKTPKEEVLKKLKEAAPRKPQPEVHIRGDLNTPYEFVGRVVAYCQKAGILRVGFLTEPKKN